MFSISWTNGLHDHTVVAAREDTIRMLYAMLASSEVHARWHVSSIHVFDVAEGKELDPENDFDLKEAPHDAERN